MTAASLLLCLAAAVAPQPAAVPAAPQPAAPQPAAAVPAAAVPAALPLDSVRPFPGAVSRPPIVWDGSGAEFWRPVVAAYFSPAEVEAALAIIQCESGGNPDAANPTSGAAGLFQHLPRYWADRSAAAGWPGANIMEPAPNVAVAAWLQSANGWRPWVCSP